MIKEKAETEQYRLDQIYFYITEGCNLACRHCWIAPKFQDKGRFCPSLDLDLFRSIAEQAKAMNVSEVKLCGGEPLLHPKIAEILALVKDYNFGLSIETNGVLCTYHIALLIAKCRASVSVSLDGTDAVTHEWMRGVEGCFEDAIKGIKNLVDAGLKPQIIMSLVRRNKDQVEGMARLAESLGCGSVKFNVVQPTARGEKMHQAGETLTIKELVELGEMVDNKLSSSTKLALFYDHPSAFKPLGKMYGKRGNGCSVCNILHIIGVLADGFYALCGIGENVPELVFGDAGKVSLEEVWKYNPVLLEIRKGLPVRLEGVCKNCIMKPLCLGSCIAQNYYRTKKLWSPYWYCEEAYREGLFPKSRLMPQASLKKTLQESL